MMLDVHAIHTETVRRQADPAYMSRSFGQQLWFVADGMVEGIPDASFMRSLQNTECDPWASESNVDNFLLALKERQANADD